MSITAMLEHGHCLKYMLKLILLKLLKKIKDFAELKIIVSSIKNFKRLIIFNDTE